MPLIPLRKSDAKGDATHEPDLEELQLMYQKLIPRGKSAPSIRQHLRKLRIQLNSAPQVKHVMSSVSRRSACQSAGSYLTLHGVTQDISVTPLRLHNQSSPKDVPQRESVTGKLTTFGEKKCPAGLTTRPIIAWQQDNTAATFKHMPMSSIHQQGSPDHLAGLRERLTQVAIPRSSDQTQTTQSQRFSNEQQSLERTRLLKRFSHIQTHRVDHQYFVKGSAFPARNRYGFDESHYSLMLQMIQQRKQEKMANSARTQGQYSQDHATTELAMELTPNPAGAQSSCDHPSGNHHGDTVEIKMLPGDSEVEIKDLLSKDHEAKVEAVELPDGVIKKGG